MLKRPDPIITKRGYKSNPPVPYYTGSDTRCPACTGTNWDVRRSTAECSRCAYPLVIGVY